MTISPFTPTHTSLPSWASAAEDGGLREVVRTQPAGLAERAAFLEDSEVLRAAQDVLRAQLALEYIDPFAPAAERNAQVVAVLRQAIIAERQAHNTASPLFGLPSDIDSLLALYGRTLGWGPIQKYLDDPRINEIKINGTAVLVQESGQDFVLVPERFRTTTEVLNRVLFLASLLRVRLDESAPQTTLPLAHGTRMHITIPPLADDGGVLVCIRRGRTNAWDLDDLLARGSCNRAIAELLRLFVRARCCILVAGATGSGKTALLEALVNSISDDTHVMTIEDLTREIVIRRSELWTRELIDTSRDQSVYGRVAREALRQTPGYLIPGETRADEAGAILSMALASRPVMTSMHARTCREAIERFASYAALPDAYMYAGRREDALRDAATGFDIVIHTDVLAGRRLITEIALPAGTAHDPGGRIIALLAPLAQLTTSDEGQVDWNIHALPAANGQLAWNNGAHTPEHLERKLRAAQMAATLRLARPSVNDVMETLERAQQALSANEPERALNIMRPAWTRTRDHRLLEQARRALSMAPLRFTADVRNATQQHTQLQAALHKRQWMPAHEQLERLMGELAHAAAAEPGGGWEPLAGQIRAGLVEEADIRRACADAEVEIAADRPWVALELVQRFDIDQLAAAAALPVLCIREAAHQSLLSRGEGSHDVLATVQARKAALEQLLNKRNPYAI